jgi:hypothetical protein
MWGLPRKEEYIVTKKDMGDTLSDLLKVAHYGLKGKPVVVSAVIVDQRSPVSARREFYRMRARTKAFSPGPMRPDHVI